MSLAGPPEQGSLVQVRQRPFVVLDVQRSAVVTGPLRAGRSVPQHLVTLSSVEDDALGEELQVIWEIEPGARVVGAGSLPTPEGFDEPRTSRRLPGRRALGRGLLAPTCTRSQAPFRSGIEIWRITSSTRWCGRSRCRASTC